MPEPVIAPFCVGTVFNATLVTPLDARRNKAGDTVLAETSETVTYERSVIFPKNTKVHGHLVRASSARSGKGSALFVQFDKATLKNGQDVMMNAGIQALVTGRGTVSSSSGYTAPSEEVMPRTNSPAGENGAQDVSTPTVVPASQELTPRAASGANAGANSPAAQGSMDKRGMLTPESTGALGSSNIKVYTPLSEGSDGTVLISPDRNVHLEAGTKLLLVIQPPPESDPSLQ
ncbi:MAG TPA: hypothetical protein VIM00_05830 [Candidatus Acidoferrum sp.]